MSMGPCCHDVNMWMVPDHDSGWVGHSPCSSNDVGLLEPTVHRGPLVLFYPVV